MTTRGIIVFVGLISLTLLGCKGGKKSNAYPLNSTSLSLQFAEQIKLEQDSVLAPILAQVTATNQYVPFISSTKGLSDIDSLITLMNKAKEHGFYNQLKPQIEKVNFLKAQVDSSFVIGSKDSTSHLVLAKLEKEALFTALQYHKIMNYGAVNPKEVFLSGYHLPVIQPDSAYYTNFLTTKNKLEAINKVYPKDPRYKPLQEKYVEYKNNVDTTWKALPKLSVKKMEPNKQYAMVPLLRKKFGLPAIVDSLNGESIPNIEYDELTVNKVKEYQKRNGLKPDGIIGPATHEALNKSPQDILSHMEASLERFRWPLNINTTDYIRVNIPDYNLVYFENGKAIDTIVVVVGKKHPKNYYKFTADNRPVQVRNYETPEFMDTLETIVVNPKWNVPRSISTLEILPNVKANPYYLLENNYRVFYGREEQPRDSLDWWEYTEENFPYRIVQDPGAGNALGRIKFLFPNKYSIYLHDTPSKRYFYVDNRAQSHGCVRVREPYKLGDLILKDSPVYKEAKTSEDLKIINVKSRMQVTITYYTAWIDDKGELQIRNDVYGKDEELLNALRNSLPDQLLAAAS